MEIHRRHIQSDLYTLESEASVLMSLQMYPNLSSFRRLLMLASVDLSLLIIGFAGAMIASGSNIGFQVMFGTIIENIFLHPHSLDSDTAIQMIFCVGMFLGNFLQMGFIEMAGTRLVTRVQRYTFAAIVEQDMGFFDVHQTGELTTILTANTALVRNGATTQLALALKGFVQFIAILTYLCITNGTLTGFFMGIALIPLAVSGFSLTCIAKITKNMTDSQGQQGAIAEEHVGGIRTSAMVVVLVVCWCGVVACHVLPQGLKKKKVLIDLLIFFFSLSLFPLFTFFEFFAVLTFTFVVSPAQIISGTVSSFSMQEKAKAKYDTAAKISNYWGVVLSWVQGSTFAFVIGGFYMALSFAQWRGGQLILGEKSFTVIHCDFTVIHCDSL